MPAFQFLDEPQSQVASGDLRVLAAIDRSAAAALNRYADHRASDLRAVLADRLGLEADQVGIGCGSVGLLQQILLAYVDPGDEVVYGWRSFEAYPIYTTIAAATVVAVPNRFEALDMPAMTAAVTERTRVVFVTSPNCLRVPQSQSPRRI